jgi:hypothetical protein
MKIYLYCTESGIYQGEDFADSPMRIGDFSLPAGATTVAPPDFGAGETAVFVQDSMLWEVVPVAAGLNGNDRPG